MRPPLALVTTAVPELRRYARAGELRAGGHGVVVDGRACGGAGSNTPYTLAYVDLDGGPRVLAHIECATPIGAGDPTGAVVVRLAPGTSVVVRGATADGDVLVGVS